MYNCYVPKKLKIVLKGIVLPWVLWEGWEGENLEWGHGTGWLPARPCVPALTTTSLRAEGQKEELQGRWPVGAWQPLPHFLGPDPPAESCAQAASATPHATGSTQVQEGRADPRADPHRRGWPEPRACVHRATTLAHGGSFTGAMF